jgi:hypothetical protein
MKRSATSTIRSTFSARVSIQEFGALGWHEWAARPTPFETSLRRKSGLFARQFMALWVEEDGSVWTNYVGEGGSLRGLPDNFGKPPWNPTFVRSGPDHPGVDDA